MGTRPQYRVTPLRPLLGPSPISIHNALADTEEKLLYKLLKTNSEFDCTDENTRESTQEKLITACHKSKRIGQNPNYSANSLPGDSIRLADSSAIA